jgi:phosphoglycerate dehydrogenase-like enzyme
VVRKKVLATALVEVPGAEQPAADVLKRLLNELNEIADVEAHRPATFQEWLEAVKGVSVILGYGPINEKLLRSVDMLEMVQNTGIGYDNIDVSACTRRGILTCNVAEIYSEPVAQHAWALILDLSKNVSKADRFMRLGKYRPEAYLGVQLWGKTLGIVGLGGNGTRIALKGRLAFGMRVLAYDPYILPARAQRYGAELVGLKRLLRESDVVSLSPPLTAETRHMIGEKELSLMKNSAILINTSRGAVIDQKALIKCLQRGGIRGAGLDVFEAEPLSPDSPLLTMENIVLTPHIASSTTEAVEKTYEGATENIIRYIKGEKPYWIINPEAYKQ